MHFPCLCSQMVKWNVKNVSVVIENDSYYITHYTVNNFYFTSSWPYIFFLLILYPAHNPPKSKDTLGVQEVGGTKQTSSSSGNCDLSSETNQTFPKGTRKSEDCVVNQCSTSTQEETSEINVKRGNERTSCKKNIDSKKTPLEGILYLNGLRHGLT